MKIAVLSGKGGTGKTTVSASLADSLEKCQYIDCDVEEPNGYIFLKPEISEKVSVDVLVPKVDKKKCNYCGECGKACQYNAIAVIKENVLIFPEICHHCGACALVCSNDAIYEVKRNIGVVEMTLDSCFIQGRLNIGEPISIPIINELKNRVKDDIAVVLDCPPGASCSVVQSIENCNYCILVTEPTPFGLHDLKIAVKLVEKMKIPFGVIINKSSDKETNIKKYCQEKGIDILMEIPFSKEIAKAYSNGILPVEIDSGLKKEFNNLYKKVKRSIVK